MLWRKVLENNASVAFVSRPWLSRGKVVTGLRVAHNGPNSDCVSACDNLFLAILNIWDFLVYKLTIGIYSFQCWGLELWDQDAIMGWYGGKLFATLEQPANSMATSPKVFTSFMRTQDLVTSQRPCSHAITWNQGSNRQSLAGEKYLSIYLSIINPNSKHQSLQICGTS